MATIKGQSSELVSPLYGCGSASYLWHLYRQQSCNARIEAVDSVVNLQARAGWQASALASTAKELLEQLTHQEVSQQGISCRAATGILAACSINNR